MSNRHRLPYAALGGYLAWLVLAGLAWPSLAQGDKRDEQPPGQSQADTKQTPAQPPAAPAVTADKPQTKPEPKSYRDPCSDPKYGYESDLCQQWRMAEAAEETADWTYGQIIATGIEAILLAIAIGIASWAGFWARRAAIAGSETVDITREIGRAQTRAYVVIATETRWAAVGDVNEPTAYAFTIRWDNAGITPARRGRSSINTDAFVGDIPADFDYPDTQRDRRPDERFTERSHVGPKKYVESTVTIPKPDAQAAERRNKRVFVWGWFEYNDIFNGTPRHRTEICLEIIIGAGARTCMVTITGPFNGADDDCLHKAKT